MNLGFPEMIFIFLLALIIFGPRKLPEVGRQLGKFMAEFKRASNEFKSQIESEMRQIEWEESQKKAAPPVLQAPEGSVINSGSLAESTPSEPVAALPPTVEPTSAHAADA